MRSSLTLIFLIVCVFSTSSSALRVSIDQYEAIIKAFLDGLEVTKTIEQSEACVHDSVQFVEILYMTGQAARHRKGLQTALNFTDALAELSPIAHHCVDCYQEVIEELANYFHQFVDYKDFMAKVGINVMANLFDIQAIIGDLANYSAQGDMVNAAHEFGVLIHAVFHVQIDGRFSRSRPEVSQAGSFIDPIIDPEFREEFMFAQELAYKALTKSRLATGRFVDMCDVSLIKYYDAFVEMVHIYRNNQTKNATYALLDSFALLHPIVEGCYYTTYMTATNLVNGLGMLKHPEQILNNTKSNAFWVGSDAAGVVSQFYYEDVEHIVGMFADFVYRVLFFGRMKRIE